MQTKSGQLYLPPVEDVDSDALVDKSRKPRLHVFRPLFVYRQQQINKMRIDSQRRKDKMRRLTKTTTVKPTTTMQTIHAHYHPAYQNYHGYSSYSVYTEKPTYYRPPYRLPYDSTHVLNSYPRIEYPAKYPTYVWSNYIDSPNRRTWYFECGDSFRFKLGSQR